MDATVTSGDAEVEQEREEEEESGGLVRRGRRSADAAGRLWWTMGFASRQQRADEIGRAHV